MSYAAAPVGGANGGVPLRDAANILSRMKNTLRHAVAALVLITLVLLAACGNKGDLVRPSEAGKAAADE